METQNSQKDGRFEELEQRTTKLLSESVEPQFTEYLYSFRNRLYVQQHQLDLLREELERSYRMYISRNVQTQEAVQTENAQVENTQTEIQQQGEAPAVLKTVPRNNVEFTIGVVAFSVIGVAFILTAFVMLGMTYANSFTKGMSLYAIPVLLLLFSEIVLYKKLPKLSRALTAIGVGGIYLSTVLNYLNLRNFNGLTAMVITVVVTAGTLLLSRKKDSSFLRIMGMLACYICFLPVGENITGGEFAVITGMLFLLNVMSVAVPVRKAPVALGITHLICNLVFSFMMVGIPYEIELPYQLGFVLSNIVVVNLIFYSLLRSVDKEKSQGKAVNAGGSIAAFCISSFIHIILLRFVLIEESFWEWVVKLVFHENTFTNVEMTCFSIAILTAVSIVFFLLQYKRREKWLQYIFLNIGILFLYVIPAWEEYGVMCFLGLLLVSKILLFSDEKILRTSDLILTILFCLGGSNEFNLWIIVGVLISVLFLRHWTTVYEIVLTFTLVQNVRLVLNHAGYEIFGVPVTVGILFVGLLLFNNVKRWQGEKIKVFNYMAVLGCLCALLAFPLSAESDNVINHVMLLVFGLAVIVITFHEKYHMEFKAKHLVAAIFLTYMALIFPAQTPVVTSILMMSTALISVVVGFCVQQRSVRIYGLVLSLFVCGKITLYDFAGIPTLQKTILFFVVGVIALVISGIYIILEKKSGERE